MQELASEVTDLDRLAMLALIIGIGLPLSYTLTDPAQQEQAAEQDAQSEVRPNPLDAGFPTLHLNASDECDDEIESDSHGCGDRQSQVSYAGVTQRDEAGRSRAPSMPGEEGLPGGRRGQGTFCGGPKSPPLKSRTP